MLLLLESRVWPEYLSLWIRSPGILVYKFSISFHWEALHKKIPLSLAWCPFNLWPGTTGTWLSKGPLPQNSTEELKTSAALYLTCRAKSVWIRGALFANDKLDTLITKSFLPSPQGFKSFPSKLQFVKKPLKWCCARKLKQAQKDGVTFHHLLVIIIMPLLCLAKCLIDCAAEAQKSCHNLTKIIPKLYLCRGREIRSVFQKTNFEHMNFLVAEW